MNKIKVLHVVPFLDGGGIERLLLNYYKEMNHNKINFDFIKHISEEGILEKEFKNLNSKIFFVHSKQKKLIKNIIGTFKIIKKEKYSIVHIHMGFSSWICALICKVLNVKNVIIHSHNVIYKETIIKKIANKIQSLLINFFSDHKFYCSSDAKKWMFGPLENSNEFFMENAINLSDFKFNIDQREKNRKELNIDNKIVIAQIGRICDQKNQLFTVDIINELIKYNENIVLLFVGRGPLEKDVYEKVKEMKLEKHIKFMGIREDVNEILQAADIFIFPSKYEGLGIAALEAQALGIPCLVSDRVPKEVKQTNHINFISLESSAKVWAKKINETKILRHTFINFNNKNYDLKNSSNKLYSFYERLEK